MIQFSSDFIILLENLYYISYRLLFHPVSANIPEERFYKEICKYIKNYSYNIHNPPSETKKDDLWSFWYDPIVNKEIYISNEKEIY